VAASAFGQMSAASGDYSTALGQAVVASGENSIAVGVNSQASAKNAIAIGSGAIANNFNSVALGAGSDTARNNTVSVGSASNQRTISNLAPGVQGTDAANMSQLNSSTKSANRGIAGISAIAGLPGVDAGKDYGFGFGNYGNASAIAMGGQVRLADHLNLKIGASSSTGSYASSMGLGYSF